MLAPFLSVPWPHLTWLCMRGDETDALLDRLSQAAPALVDCEIDFPQYEMRAASTTIVKLPHFRRLFSRQADRFFRFLATPTLESLRVWYTVNLCCQLVSIDVALPAEPRAQDCDLLCEMMESRWNVATTRSLEMVYVEAKNMPGAVRVRYEGMRAAGLDVVISAKKGGLRSRGWIRGLSDSVLVNHDVHTGIASQPGETRWCKVRGCG